MLWLAVPRGLFDGTKKTEGGPIIVTLIGGVLLILVLSWVPFLQAHFAAENWFGAMFELKKVRQLFKNAPFSWLITMLITLTMALPMYLFKIALPPSDMMWLVTIVFIVSIYPAKVITRWAYHRAVALAPRAFLGPLLVTRPLPSSLPALAPVLVLFSPVLRAARQRGVLDPHVLPLH